MVQQITKGIKISVKTKYNGVLEQRAIQHQTFSYFITIENTSENTVQLTNRFWKIYDSKNNTEIVDGKGVVGQTPIILPGETYAYSSGCFLQSNIGAMKGYYTMTNLETQEQFKVIIPTFQLTTPILSN